MKAKVNLFNLVDRIRIMSVLNLIHECNFDYGISASKKFQGDFVKFRYKKMKGCAIEKLDFFR
jgi:hypothetical protein